MIRCHLVNEDLNQPFSKYSNHLKQPMVETSLRHLSKPVTKNGDRPLDQMSEIYCCTFLWQIDQPFDCTHFLFAKKEFSKELGQLYHGEHFHCTWKSSISIVIIVILTMIMIITIFIFTATIIIIIITMMMKIKNPVLADERPTVVPLCSTGHKIPVTAFLLFSFFHLHKILIYQEI